jgi:hypothetical protein
MLARGNIKKAENLENNTNMDIFEKAGQVQSTHPVDNKMDMLQKHNSTNSAHTEKSIKEIEEETDEITEKLVESLSRKEEKFEATHPDGTLFEQKSNEDRALDDLVNINNIPGIGKIPQQKTREFMESIYTAHKKIYLRFDASNQKFSFFDVHSRNLGSFRVEHLIKYIASFYDVKRQFLNFVDPTAYQQAKILIKTYVGYPEINKKIKFCQINLHDVQQSPFMGDVEMLVRLNDLLYNFEKTSLDRELNYVDAKYKPHIKRVVKQLIYMLLNYTIKLIAYISEEIVHRTDKDRLKEQLVKYSVGISYRISIFVQEQLGVINKRNGEMEKLIDDNRQLRKFVTKKMDALVNQLSIQNSLMLEEKRRENQQIGGATSRKQREEMEKRDEWINDNYVTSGTGSEKGMIQNASQDNIDSKLELNSTEKSKKSTSIDDSSDNMLSDSRFSAIYDI